MRARTSLSILLPAVALALLGWWLSRRTEPRESVSPAHVEEPVERERRSASENSRAPLVPPTAPPDSAPAPHAIEELLALAERAGARLDFAKSELDAELVDQVRALVLERSVSAYELRNAALALAADDPRTSLLVLASAWSTGVDAEIDAWLARLAVQPEPGTPAAEQAALAAVHALDLGARELALANAADELWTRTDTSGAHILPGLTHVRLWIALRGLDLALPLAEHELAGARASDTLPIRVREELWAAAVRGGDAAWRDEALERVREGDDAARAGVAAIADPDSADALASEFDRASVRRDAWTCIALAKALVQSPGNSSRAALLRALEAPADGAFARDAALEALASFRLPRERVEELPRVLALARDLAHDEPALAALERGLERALGRVHASLASREQRARLAAELERALATLPPDGSLARHAQAWIARLVGAQSR
ncbi:MAG: hypothetical protein IT454_23230 [Planctomycetes bacterium]|nr:hypothetical protein [Planctomycetota bacterium]